MYNGSGGYSGFRCRLVREHNNISGRPESGEMCCRVRVRDNGTESDGEGGGGWRPCSQSTSLLRDHQDQQAQYQFDDQLLCEAISTPVCHP